MVLYRVVSITTESVSNRAFSLGQEYTLRPGDDRTRNGFALSVPVLKSDIYATVVGHCLLQRVDTIDTPPTLPEVSVPPTVNHGGKDDGSKGDPTMLFSGCANALNAVQQVLEGGAKKYAANTWQKVPDGINRYWRAFSRHKVEVDIHGLEAVNPDFGLLHIDHMITDLLFIRELMFKQNRG